MIQKKVCLLGSFGVGKSSLLRRYVQSVFDGKYRSTIGVKVDKKTVTVFGQTVNLILWDVEGKEEASNIPDSYLRGMAGCLLVADGTRTETLKTLRDIRRQVRVVVGPVPCVVLINKLDLYGQWMVTEDDVADMIGDQHQVLRTSAKTGEQVEQAFELLAQKMVKP